MKMKWNRAKCQHEYDYSERDLKKADHTQWCIKLLTAAFIKVNTKTSFEKSQNVPMY